MATKTKSRKITTSGHLPALRSEDPGWGVEPHFDEQPTDDGRKLSLVRSLAWYAANINRKIAKDALLHYATERGVGASDLKILKSAHERHFDLQCGALARLAGRGLQLSTTELAIVGDHLLSVIAVAKKNAVETLETDDAPKVIRPNIQETMMAKARECAGELEGYFDAFLTDGNPQPDQIGVVGLLTERNILPAHVGGMIAAWTARRDEYQTVLDKGDEQLIEGYSQYGRVAMKSLVKWCDAVIAGLQSYATVKRAARAPRKRKPVPLEKLVAKVKYLKTFKDEALKLELTSVHPAKLVGAAEAFVYDTAKRRLTHYIADSHAGTLSVKGTTVLGYDAVKSQTKTVRKPGVTLPALIKAGKPAARKVFAELTTVGTQPNGRTNENTVIVRVS